ncbi:whirlin isoform X2 [Cylas formicarius]|uniref:whirlin isoform X2 n=1 Tax=Cylas formicarius TaxID=197179 RepID=UPI002958BD5C|nr:whirlin isoform X2 [Cylas formicarius]
MHAGGDEYSELAELGGYGATKRYGGGSHGWRATTLGASPAEAEDAIGADGSPRSHPGRPRSGLYYSPPGTSYTIVERPSSVMHHRERDYGSTRDRDHYSTLNPRGTYLGSNPNFSSTRTLSSSNNKKRPISPEQVLRLFGSANHSSGSKANPERPRRSPASSPPSTTHQINYRPPVYSPSIHELITRTVTMVRDPQDGTHGFGICVKGGKEAGVGVYISRVEEGSVAERVGLRPGDSILEVNGKPFTGISHEEALKMLKSCRKLSMTVRSPALPGDVLGGRGASWQRQTCSWMDRHGRPVSPPIEYSGSGRGPSRCGFQKSAGKERNVRRVDLCIEPGQSLGLMIRGGVEYNLGIFITGVDKDSVADRGGLMVGDQILEVNGQSFLDVTHDEAVAQLKYHKRMSLLVRDVGKVPHSCTAYDRDWDLCSPGSRAAATTRKWAAALQMVEEKARCLLARPEFTTLCYYTDEYVARHMTIDAFVQCMTELLNTPDKYTLMTELREIVAVEDRSRFDELVYRRDAELLKTRDPREHDYRHSRRKGIPVPEANHSIYAGYPQDYEFLPQGIFSAEDYRSPSEDSGLGMGYTEKQNVRKRPPSAPAKCVSEINEGRHQSQEYVGGGEEDALESRRHSSPGDSRSGSTTALHQQDFQDSELANKLSRSFDMKEDSSLLENEGGMRRHQSMQRLTRDGTSEPREAARVVQDEEGNLRVTVKKTKPILGIAIEGGANTKHPLPRIININENGAAYSCGGLEVGQLILQVDGTRVEGLQHQDVARLIAESFARRDRNDIEFLVVEAKKSNMEPKPTALIFLEA